MSNNCTIFYNNVLPRSLYPKTKARKENANNQPNNTFFTDDILSGTTLEIREETVKTVHHTI